MFRVGVQMRSAAAVWPLDVKPWNRVYQAARPRTADVEAQNQVETAASNKTSSMRRGMKARLQVGVINGPSKRNMNSGTAPRVFKT